MKTIKLFNFAHYGDIFISRNIIINLIKNGYNVNYEHHCNKGILEDIEGCSESSTYNNVVGVFDTWVGQENDSITCSYENHRLLAEKILNHCGIFNLDDEDFLPEIYIDNINNKKIIDDWLLTLEFKKIVIVSNGNTLSGQSHNFSFDDIIDQLSNEYADIHFVMTNNTSISKKNVTYIGNITNIIPDLLLISYLSTLSHVIIGRCSGPYIYCRNKQNLLNSDKTFICFSHKEGEGVWYEKSKAKQVWQPNMGDREIIINTIKENL